MKCLALCVSGKPCKTNAKKGSLFCHWYTHNAESELIPGGKELLRAAQERGQEPSQERNQERNQEPSPDPTPPTPSPGPAEPPESPPAPGEASHGEISGGDGVGSASFDGSLPIHGGPEAEPSARPGPDGPVLDSDLFDRLLEGEEEAPKEEAPEEIPAEPRKPWTPERAAMLVCPIGDYFHERDGKALYTPAEKVWLGESFAASFNEILKGVDPTNPHVALLLTVLVIEGARYGKDWGHFAGSFFARLRGFPVPPSSSEAEAPPEGPSTADVGEPGELPPFGAGEGVEA